MRCAAYLILVALALGACDINGTNQEYPGASVYEAPDRGFHLFYLAPPWRHDTPASSDLVHLVVDGFGQFQELEKAITYHLHLSYLPGQDPQQVIAARRLAAEDGGKTIRQEPRALVSRSGARGWEFYAEKEKEGVRTYYRELCFLEAQGRVVLLALNGFYPLAEQDVNDLVLSYTLGAAPEVEVPQRTPSTSQPLDAGASS